MNFTSQHVKALLWCVAVVGCGTARAQCPALDALYPSSEAQWPQSRDALVPLMDQCLESTEYFALLGAAQLNSGNLPDALEALERALLIDPDNGAALVDYAQALYVSGQLFAALELNQRLLARQDLPGNVRPIIAARQQVWNRQRHLFTLVGELSAGFDTNLNGAPLGSEIVLTISGESVTLPLDEAFQPREGGFANARLLGNYSVQGVDTRHDLLFSLRNRTSTDQASDIIQFDWRYGFARTLGGYDWELTTGTSHLMFGGSPLYSVAEVRSRLKVPRTGCAPFGEAAAQYQRYHGQTQVSGIETSLGGGLECLASDGLSRTEVGAGLLLNEGTENLRSGGDRQGWRMQVRWQRQLPMGSLDFSLAYARLRDAIGYSTFLENGAVREVENYQARLMYQYQAGPRTRFFTGLNHQNQTSNLGPFKNSGTAMDIGLQHRF